MFGTRMGVFTRPVVCVCQLRWLPPPGCRCTGHESVHGFGAFCRGWEFEGQPPWCYVDDACASAEGEGGSFNTKHAPCVKDVPPPPPNPPPPPPIVSVATGAVIAPPPVPPLVPLPATREF